jgi:hypothetical protein
MITGILQQIARGAGPDSRKDQLVLIEGRQHNDRDSGQNGIRGDSLSSPDSVEPRHPGVHEYNVWLGTSHNGDCLSSVARLADVLEVVAVSQ